MTTRRWMVLVAVAAVTIEGTRMGHQSLQSTRLARKYAELEALWASGNMNWGCVPVSPEDAALLPALYHEKRLRYERAAWRPWEPVPPDPPDPE